MSSTRNARFCFNNWIDSTTITASSSHASYPASNLYGTVRSKVWQAGGLFEITSGNNKVYINATTYTLTVGSYTSATLITEFNTQTGQTLSKNSLGKFVITLGSSGTLNLSSTTNAAWGTLGFLGSSDLTGTVFTGDERRYSTSEWIKVDLGVPQIAHFAALIPPANTVFSMSDATITLQGNNVDEWSTPDFSGSMEISSSGALYAPDLSTTISPCRFWRILIVDVKNVAIQVAVAYIGDSVITDNTNISGGFTRTRSDASLRLQSEGGQTYVNRRPRSFEISSTNMLYLKDQELIDMEQLVYDLGLGRPFFVCIDPNLQVSDYLWQMTHYVEVSSDVSFEHVLSDYYNLSFSLREAL